MLTLHFNNTTLDVQESDSSYRYRSLMSKPQLVLKFSLSEFVEIPVGAWCEYQGREIQTRIAGKHQEKRNPQYRIHAHPRNIGGQHEPV